MKQLEEYQLSISAAVEQQTANTNHATTILNDLAGSVREIESNIIRVASP